MVEIFGKNYILDLDELVNVCLTEEAKEKKTNKKQDDDNNLEINIFKYEMLKLCIERVLNGFDEIDEQLPMYAQNELQISFKIAFNTLINYNILAEYDE